jgi:hypothetical protein
MVMAVEFVIKNMRKVWFMQSLPSKTWHDQIKKCVGMMGVYLGGSTSAG